MAGLGKGLASIFGENYSENSSKEIISDGITKLRLSEIEPKKINQGSILTKNH